MSFTLLFPGQGSQYVGMGASFFASRAGARLVEEAESALGFSLTKIMLSGSQEELTSTAIAQPAILLHSIAAFMAATPSATRAGSAIKHAPKKPFCTRSEGQPQFRFTSS